MQSVQICLGWLGGLRCFKVCGLTLSSSLSIRDGEKRKTMMHGLKKKNDSSPADLRGVSERPGKDG